MSLLDHLRKPGMPLSVGLHAGLVVAALVSFSFAKPLPEAIEAVAVEVVDESLLREVMRGEQSAKQAAPTQRVDRVADKVEQSAPGVAAKQIDTDKTPAKQEATAREERKEIAAVTPPLPVVPPRAAEPPKPVPTPVRAPPPTKQAEEEEEAEEAIRQKQIKRPEPPKAEPPKPDQAALAKLLEQQKRDEQKKAEDSQRREDQRKQAEAKATEDRKKAEDAKKVQEAAKKAADEKRKREAEQEARNQQALDAARRALLSSREAPQNSGNTGQVVSRVPAAGAPTATGQRLNPSDRAALVGLLADQIRACWNIPVSARPNPLPQVRVALNADGTLGATPALINSSGDPAFRPLADSGMRAIRQCSPFRIPARFAPTYNDWRSIVVQLDPEA